MQKACLSQRAGWLHYKSQELITSSAAISPRHKLKPLWLGLVEGSLSLPLFFQWAAYQISPEGRLRWIHANPLATNLLGSFQNMTCGAHTNWQCEVQSWRLMYSKALWRCAVCINYLRWGSQTGCWMLTSLDFCSLRAARTDLML